ncbi:hypothetical protein CPB84DRAFT_1743043 [Gymnopilus junonius]|uniref:Uncharacterized protein n=1 Tax=Gymnopilus junonius TaxID=109634 RepID=A0A9P5P144_GYMJU|nr:hypothetical protein CPB84DRAFT_1743043 [Gymnopilus junonius]
MVLLASPATISFFLVPYLSSYLPSFPCTSGRPLGKIRLIEFEIWRQIWPTLLIAVESVASFVHVCYYRKGMHVLRNYNSEEDEEYAREVERETRLVRAQGLPDSAVYNPPTYNQAQPGTQTMQIPAPHPSSGVVATAFMVCVCVTGGLRYPNTPLQRDCNGAGLNGLYRSEIYDLARNFDKKVVFDIFWNTGVPRQAIKGLSSKPACATIPQYPAKFRSLKWKLPTTKGDRTQYISDDNWKPIGPFPRAFDSYGDGSLYIVDSPGNVDGHMNILARTSADGAWMYLAADSAQHWKLITGEAKIKVGVPGHPYFCVHHDKAKAESILGMYERRFSVLLRPRANRERFPMASNTTSVSTSMARTSTRNFLLPEIPELFKKDFLDILLPSANDAMQVESQAAPVSTNPMMDALKATTHQTYTENMAMAYSSTLSPTLDAFRGISRYTSGPEMARYLDSAWKEDPNLTLRIIWNLRSIHDGKGEKEAFYDAFGWLYDKHPRTAISNLHLLVEPVCAPSKKKELKSATAHGYWKDLLNIVALATVDELVGSTGVSHFLHSPRTPARRTSLRIKVKTGTRDDRIAAAQAANDKAKEVAEAQHRIKQAQAHHRLEKKLTDPKFRALFIAVARLFSDQLIKDIKVLDEIEKLGPGGDRIALLKTISLAGKWAPTPTLLMIKSQTLLPPSLNFSMVPHRAAQGFFMPRASHVCNRWKEIKYNRVPSICMQNNTEHFFKHDSEGFEAYLTSVENNKRSISGATLLPHELIRHDFGGGRGKKKTSDEMKAYKKRLAETQLRVVEAQWKTLIAKLQESGSIESALAVCDVSGSMGSLNGYSYGKGDRKTVEPILPAVSLSLVLAHLAKPPFDGGFITFSSSPEFVKVDRAQSLYDQVMGMSRTQWEMNTNLQSVFVNLLLPLAIKNHVKPEDMIKRLFIFSDMQFDACQPSGMQNKTKWETNYDVIEKKYREAGYEVPQIVYWDLSAGTPTTVETESDRAGVAMMNGFSPAMLKVFMGEQEAEEEEAKKEEMEWQSVGEDGESVTVVEKAKEDAFNPVNVMKKALGRRSFDGLVVVD